MGRGRQAGGPYVQGNSGLSCVNFQVNDNTSAAGSPGEVLSRRCVTLLKTALRPDMWAKSELKLQWFDKLLMSVVGAGALGTVGPEPPPSAGRGFSHCCSGRRQRRRERRASPSIPGRTRSLGSRVVPLPFMDSLLKPTYWLARNKHI